MGFLSGLFGKATATGASGLAEAAGNLAGDLRDAITGEENKLKAAELQLKLAELRSSITLAEAQSARLFVAGWRPFLGWAIGASVWLKYVVFPILGTYTKLKIPDLDFGAMYTLLQLLLGGELVAARTFEKLRGAQRNH
jgi:hypothetical protein